MADAVVQVDAVGHSSWMRPLAVTASDRCRERGGKCRPRRVRRHGDRCSRSAFHARRNRSAFEAFRSTISARAARSMRARKKTAVQPAFRARFVAYVAVSPGRSSGDALSIARAPATAREAYSGVHTIGNACRGGCQSGLFNVLYHSDAGAVAIEPATAVAATAKPVFTKVGRRMIRFTPVDPRKSAVYAAKSVRIVISLYTARSVRSVISLGAKTRNGGPQKPVPRLV